MRRAPTMLLCGFGLVLASSLLILRVPAAAEFECALGNKISAGLGDGVTLHSCSWEKTPGNFVRTGPLQLIKNGVVILKLKTDGDGKLQGEYSAWDDHGVLTERGQYHNGLKEGEWRAIDDHGNTRVILFRAGIPLMR